MDNVVSNLFSTAQVAEAMGVGVSTVKRWVDEGRIPCCKTPGGHRKLMLSDVMRFIKDGNFPQLDLAKLVPASLTTPFCPHQSACELAGHLLRGREAEARDLIRNAYAMGIALDFLSDEVIGPAMKIVGHQWESGKIDVLEEHRASQICLASIYEIKGSMESLRQESQPIAVGGGPEGDPYAVANLLIETLLLDLGWDVINLGPNTPMASFERATEKFHPKLIWVSVSYLADPSRFFHEYERFFAVAQERQIAVVLGGQGLTEDLRRKLSYTHYGDGLKHLVAFAKTLHPLPPRPQRGRPRKVTP